MRSVPDLKKLMDVELTVLKKTACNYVSELENYTQSEERRFIYVDKSQLIFYAQIPSHSTPLNCLNSQSPSM